ncbi:MAG: archaetidylserine decarboxylase [Myxococcaceae bacterium]
MHLLWLLPKNSISRLMGKLAALRLPLFFREPFLKAFGNFFGVDFSEIANPLSSFESLQDFFIRRLKPGLRPVDSANIISPCDGAFGQCGQIQAGQLLQIKGRNYQLADLLGEAAPEFENGYFTTIYLSPKDYHRFHMPISAPILKARYLPGYLWPVNAWAVKNIDQLFCVNERIVCWLGEEAILVAVGATMVGKVKLAFDPELTTNIKGSKNILKYYETRIFQKGEELGYFEFGSTVVLLTKTKLQVGDLGFSVRLGSRLG